MASGIKERARAPALEELRVPGNNAKHAVLHCDTARTAGARNCLRVSGFRADIQRLFALRAEAVPHTVKPLIIESVPLENGTVKHQS